MTYSESEYSILHCVLDTSLNFKEKYIDKMIRLFIFCSIIFIFHTVVGPAQVFKHT